MFAREVEVQALERTNAKNRDWNDARHARHDASIQQDSAAIHFADVGELYGVLVLLSAPTEP